MTPLYNNPRQKKCSNKLTFSDELKTLNVAYEQPEGPPIVEESEFMFVQSNNDIYMAWDDDIVRMKGQKLAGDGTFKSSCKSTFLQSRLQ